MAILHRMLIHAAKRIATDARVRAKAVEVFDNEVKPRAQEAWRRTKSKRDAAKAELQDIACETDPREHPRAFAAKVKELIANRKKRR